MEKLNKNLKFIEHWLKKHNFQSYQSLQPGIIRGEFSECADELNFRIPDSTYLLYKWHDGMEWLDDQFPSPYQLIPGYTFNSLETALDLRCEIYDEVAELFEYELEMGEHPWSKHFGITNNCFLPVMTLDKSDHICILGNKLKHSEFPVIRIFLEGSLNFLYDSVTTMVASIAECYRSDAYYEDFFHDDMSQTRKPFINYNSQLVNSINQSLNPKSVLSQKR